MSTMTKSSASPVVMPKHVQSTTRFCAISQVTVNNLCSRPRRARPDTNLTHGGGAEARFSAGNP